MRSTIQKVLVGLLIAALACAAALFVPGLFGNEAPTELSVQPLFSEPAESSVDAKPSEVPVATTAPVATAIVVELPPEPTPLPAVDVVEAPATPQDEAEAQPDDSVFEAETAAELAPEPDPTPGPPEPTATPVAPEEVEPTTEPEPTVAPVATEEVEPTAEPTPEPAIPVATEVVATAIPTATPEPIIVIEPSPTPIPTAEPTPLPVPTATPVPEPTATPEPTAVASSPLFGSGWMFVDSDTGLFLRDAPGGQITNVLTHRSQVFATGVVESSGAHLWMQIDQPQIGWVALSFLTTEQPAAPPPSLGPTRPTEPPTEADWAAFRNCESGGRYDVVDPSGLYHGAYQFLPSTWDGLARRFWPELVGVLPSIAAPADQDKMAKKLFDLEGISPWPVCGQHLL